MCWPCCRNRSVACPRKAATAFSAATVCVSTGWRREAVKREPSHISLRFETTENEMTGLLIKGGLVVDGTRAPAHTADIRIQYGRIREIGPNLAAKDEQIIDASGSVVAP